MWHWTRALPTSCLTLVALAASACGDDDPAPSTATRPDAATSAAPAADASARTLDEAVAATRAARTAAFRVRFSVRGAGNAASSDESGAVDFERQLERSKGSLTNRGKSNPIETFASGEAAYLKLADRGRWEVDPGEQAGALPGSASENLLFVRLADGPVRDGGSAQLAGGPARRYVTSTSFVRLASHDGAGRPDRFSDVGAGRAVPVEAWVDASGRIVRVRTTQATRSGRQAGTTSVNDLELGGFGKATTPATPAGLPPAA